MRKDKTPEEIKAVVLKKGVTNWYFRNCSICGHAIGYRFMMEEPYWDGNCECTKVRTDLEPRTWEDVAKTFNALPNGEQAKYSWLFN